MSLNIEYVIYLAIFVAVLLLVQGIYLLVFGKSISLNSKVSRRLEMMEKGEGREQVLEKLRKEMGQHAGSRWIPLYSILANKAQKANIAFSPAQLMMMMGALAVVAFFFMNIARPDSSMAVHGALSVTMGIAAVYIWVSRTAAKRYEMLEEQLPDAIDLMVRSLRVGHPFSAALGIVATEIPDPLGTEMGLISDESAYGRNVGEALKNMADRIDMQDMRFLAVAVTIQQTSGGNLAEILHGLSSVIRSRFRLFRRVKAITAEAKWSGGFLSMFPILALVVINLIKPDYYDAVKETEYYVPAAIFVATFLVVNMIVMRILVNIKV